MNDLLNIGLIGIGYRGIIHLENCLQRNDVRIIGIAEPNNASISDGKFLFDKYQKEHPKFYSNEDGYKDLLNHHSLDAVIISVPWDYYFDISSYALSFPIYVGIEAASATCLEQLYRLKEIKEKSGAECMLLENTCYHRDVMAVKNMVNKGVFGELVHCRGGYEHDLRPIKFDKEMNFGRGVNGEASWRTKHSITRNGDLYPTHGIGPISSILNINKGNKFTSIVSHASKSVGLKSYVEKNEGKHHPNAKDQYILGDVITSTLTTSNGETILLTHNTNLPRPYSLGFRVQGTKGVWIQEHGNHLHLEDYCDNDEWMKNSHRVFNEFDHDDWKNHQYEAAKTARHQMDYFVLREFISSIKEQRKPEFDIYDMLTWLAISPLSEESIRNGSKTLEFPDFSQ
ncbi:Gfo/Idh/MocA family oxidoreductase [Flammeovirga sp. MY04]|uniref:Gfo/Idh/MocA family protein n=1 Tax=Flammeovirga sp. MY04 TaxID=1191459 RepID=UPI00080620BC|nr:Gfo/Idh/MocA family oxidoreductase [Flammeovirga sp. MY04]ANQ48836.1 Gfo/Idh/MocA family oxidoreductase [Flammeovirga sp. MY04]